MEKIMSYVQSGTKTYGANKIEVFQWNEGAICRIGKYCSVADRVKIFLGGDHKVNWVSTFPHKEQNGTKGDIIIGNDVWLGHGVTIMSGVTIGDGAVIAANSHVVKNVEPYTVSGGNPAKFIRYRFEKSIIDLLLELKWWDLQENEINDMKDILCSEPNHEKILELVIKYRRK
jgi:acetyltransferase-like isoleucine patch superfamily enzyme